MAANDRLVFLGLPDALPAADPAVLAPLLRSGTMAIDRSALDLKRRVDAAPRRAGGAVVLLHQHLAGADAALVRGFAQSGVPTVLLVEEGQRRADDLLVAPLPYGRYVLAQMERLGCAGVATWPPVGDELGLRIEEALELAASGRMSEAAAAPRAALAGGIIAFAGAAGGAGKTCLAANVAALLAVAAGRRAILVDLTFANGRVEEALGLAVPPGRGLEPLHAAAAPLVHAATRSALGERGRTPADETLLRGVAQKALAEFDPGPFLLAFPHAGAGGGAGAAGSGRSLDVLTGVATPQAAARVAPDADTLHAVLDLLRARHDDVIVDLGTDTTSRLHESLAARADLLVLVTWPTPDSVAAVARGYAALTRATGLPVERCRLVINHLGNDRTGLVPPVRSAAQIGGAVPGGAPLRLAGLVPEDRDLVGRALLENEDLPLLPVLLPDAGARRSRFVRALRDLVEHLRPGVLPPQPSALEEWAARLGPAAARLAARARPLLPRAVPLPRASEDLLEY